VNYFYHDNGTAWNFDDELPFLPAKATGVGDEERGRPGHTALVMRGGGSRSYVACIGYLRALHDAGLLKHIGNQSISTYSYICTSVRSCI
jgi:hypothetical protein